MNDQCRQEFEKWINAGFSPLYVTGMKDDRYTCTWVADCWQGWQAAWKVSPPPVTRDGWLTADEIDDIRVALFSGEPIPTDMITKAIDMASAAISLHANHAALVAQLRSVIETIERGNV